jgi:hypothetical protein
VADLLTTYVCAEVKPWYYGPPAETPALPPEKERKQQRFKAEKDPLSAMGVFLQRKKQIESVRHSLPCVRACVRCVRACVRACVLCGVCVRVSCVSCRMSC